MIIMTDTPYLNDEYYFKRKKVLRSLTYYKLIEWSRKNQV